MDCKNAPDKQRFQVTYFVFMTTEVSENKEKLIKYQSEIGTDWFLHWGKCYWGQSVHKDCHLSVKKYECMIISANLITIQILNIQTAVNFPLLSTAACDKNTCFINSANLRIDSNFEFSDGRKLCTIINCSLWKADRNQLFHLALTRMTPGSRIYINVWHSNGN